MNRLVTDRLSDLLLTQEMLSLENLRMELTPSEKIAFVGNSMNNSLAGNRHRVSHLRIE